MSKKGVFIVIEGTDGSGKGTQFKLLVKALKKTGRQVRVVDFPQYGKGSAFFVESYLNGAFGAPKQVGPYQASFFYALDRYEAKFRLREWLNKGMVVVANRYIWSNAGHQGGKIKNARERVKYWQWLMNLEFKVLGIPEPDLSLVLHMPAKVAQKLVDKKGQRKYLKKGTKRDIHEADLGHLRAAEKSYLHLARWQHMPVVECMEKSKLLTPEEISYKVWKIVKSKIKS